MISKYLVAAAAVLGVASILSLPGPPRVPDRAASTTPVPPASPLSDTPAVIERSLAVLQTDGDAWMDGRISFQKGEGCVSCHQVPFGVWGLEEAKRAGITLDPVAAAHLAERATEFVTRPRKPRAMSWGPLILAAGADAEPSGAQSFADFVLGRQTPEGYWEAKGQFPTQRRRLAETNIVATMWTMLALAPETGDDAAVSQSLDRAYRWVDDFGDGESTEWLVLRSLIEYRFGDSTDGHRLLAQLLAQQNPDGGWSWAPGEPSNALSTGQVLYGLSLIANPASLSRQQAAGAAVAHLSRTQRADGFWTVPSVLTSTETGEGKDYVYDYWGTAWATIGLSRSLNSAKESPALGAY